jgi:dipeptidyl aminopeptidase/acylaminoacyl peptidase
VRRILVATIVACALPVSDARADALIYRCGTSICRAAPDGSANTRLTRDGGTYTWVSASRNGKRLAVVRSTFTRVLDGHGKALTGDLPRGGTAVIAEIAPDASRLATVELLPEITPAPVGSPPGSPGISGLQPYLFVMAPDGSGRDSVARAVVDTAWTGDRLTRTDASGTAPFPLGICLLPASLDFRCERDLARDPTFDLFNPAFDRGRIAVVRSSAETGTGPIVVYRNGTAQRTVTAGAAAQPSWSPDGRRIAYERGGRIYVGKRRVLKGRQPVWTTAPACRNRVGLRLRGRSAIVTACAPQPGRLTVTLRSDGRRVARRTVQTPTGRLVKIRFHRPAGRVSAAAHFSSRRRSGSA